MQLHDNKNEPETWTDPFGLFLCFYPGKIIDIFIKMLILSETVEKLVYVSKCTTYSKQGDYLVQMWPWCPVMGGFRDSTYSGLTHLSVGLWPRGHHE